MPSWLLDWKQKCGNSSLKGTMMTFLWVFFYQIHTMLLYDNVYRVFISNGIYHTFCLHLGPTQVKCRLLISSIFHVMNFRHFLEMLEFDLAFLKNVRNSLHKEC